MTTRRLRIDRRASEEFDAAADWYEAQRKGLGQEFIDAVDETIALILDNPKQGTSVPGVDEPGLRRRLARRFPYAVVYLEAADEVLVVAVAHGHRRPGYWRDRVR